MSGTAQFDADPVALVEQELPDPIGETREEWARTILTRLLEGGWAVVRFDESTGAVVDAWDPHADAECGTTHPGDPGAVCRLPVHAAGVHDDAPGATISIRWAVSA